MTTVCCVCDEPCSDNEAVRYIGHYAHICHDCSQLPDCRACGGRGEVEAEGDMMDCCGGCGKE